MPTLSWHAGAAPALIHRLSFIWVLGGRNKGLIVFSPRTWGWTGQLSITMATCRFWSWNFRSCSRTHAWKYIQSSMSFISMVRSRQSFTRLKQWGFIDFPMTSSGIFSTPSIAQGGMVKRSFRRFPTWQGSPFITSDFSG